jgi:hypothetical protein
MTPEERIAAAVQRLRLIWAFFMVGCTLGTLTIFPWWFMIFLIPLGVSTYFGALTLMAIYLSTTIRNEERNRREKAVYELQEKLDAIETEAELLQALTTIGLPEVTPVRLTSPQIGTLDGKPIYEWIELYDPRTKKNGRFYYYGAAQYEGDVPDEPGKLYANVDGVLYLNDPKCGNTSSES